MTKAKERRAHEQKIRVDAATVAIHGKIANLKEGQFYPAHDKRTESPEIQEGPQGPGRDKRPSLPGLRRAQFDPEEQEQESARRQAA